MDSRRASCQACLHTGRAFAKSKKGVGYDGMEVSDGTLVNAAGKNSACSEGNWERSRTNDTVVAGYIHWMEYWR